MSAPSVATEPKPASAPEPAPPSLVIRDATATSAAPLVLQAGRVLAPSSTERERELRDDLLYYAQTLVATKGVWALAQQAYAQEGRGALFVLVEPENKVHSQVPLLRYYGVADIKRALSACPPAYVRRIVEYDPASECLLLVALVLTPTKGPAPEERAVVACALYSAGPQ